MQGRLLNPEVLRDGEVTVEANRDIVGGGVHCIGELGGAEIHFDGSCLEIQTWNEEGDGASFRFQRNTTRFILETLGLQTK